MKSLRALKAAGLIFAAMALGLMTAQGSYAVWNAGATAAAGTVQAAGFDVEMDNGSGAAVLMTQNDGSQGTVALNVGTVNAGASSFTAVKLTNNSDAGGDFTIRASVAGSPQFSAPGNLWTIQHRAAPGGNPASCNAALFAGTQDQTVDIPKGSSGIICFQVSLAASANIQGQVTTISVPLSAAQVG
ncbi:hypothetical protein [Arthrobacter sp.]|uniref:hypothetical protein n=1 Tax=Arthrobacter sp. TaxID=1667 RepID=UPI00289B2C48|nr:hypothetical protein [Arthrobacter sp.]